MLTTKEAAAFLGVSEGRIRQLIGNGMVTAEKKGKQWQIDEASLRKRLGVKGGRPSLDDPRATIDLFTLMSREHEVARVAFDRDQGCFTKFKPLDKSRLPFTLAFAQQQGSGTLRALNRWWVMRCIPAQRPGLDGLLSACGVPTASHIPLGSFGLSLSDQYWLRPQSYREKKCRWQQVNFFHNPFVDQMQDGSGELRLGAVPSKSPDFATNGVRPKRWFIDIDDKRILCKEPLDAAGQEAVNELLATRLWRRLLRAGEYVEYALGKKDGHFVSMSSCFLGDDEEYVPVSQLLDLSSAEGSGDAYTRYFDICCKLGAPEAMERVDRMIVCDHILANAGRNWRNFGLVRNVETLELRPAPLFNASAALFADSGAGEPTPAGVFSSGPFDDDPLGQLHMVHDLRWFDAAALEGYVQEMRQILQATCGYDGALLDSLCVGVEQRIADVVAWKDESPILQDAEKGSATLRGSIEYMYL